ncbi:MAG: hypothetical protein ACI8R9_000631 [Paraglaciecola sp.]|jgi:hypothetical protein
MTTSNKEFDSFLAISAWLTGFEAIELQGTGMTSVYFSTLQKNITGANLEVFFAEARSVLLTAEKDPVAAKARTLSHLMQNSSFNNLAKQIILMWYIGQWFPEPAGDARNSTQINAQSYVESLMWPAADTHPPGAKQPGFGSWAERPIKVDTFNVTMGK